MKERGVIRKSSRRNGSQVGEQRGGGEFFLLLFEKRQLEILTKERILPRSNVHTHTHTHTHLRTVNFHVFSLYSSSTFVLFTLLFFFFLSICFVLVSSFVFVLFFFSFFPSGRGGRNKVKENRRLIFVNGGDGNEIKIFHFKSKNGSFFFF